MRIAFFGTSSFAVPALTSLADAGHEVAVVVTQPDRPSGRGRYIKFGPVKQAALDLNIPILQPNRVKSSDFQEEFASFGGFDAAVCAAFGQIIPKNVLDIPRFGFINIHPSLLPKYRGAAPIQRAIMAGEEVTGMTIMQMDAGLDTGPIFMQRQCPIYPSENAGELSVRLSLMGAEMTLEVLESLGSGKLTPQPQNDDLATYALPIELEDTIINWTEPASHTICRIRGVSPRPGAQTKWKGQILKIISTSLIENESHYPNPGAVIAVVPEGLHVATGTGSILLKEVQPENRRKMSAADFARGARIRSGDRLG